MRTFKVKTQTTTNYVLKIDGLYYAIRKNNRGYWKSVSYKANMLGTDEYNITVLDGYLTKKEAISALVRRVKEAPKHFFHIG
jgi:hypothetical protein